MNPEGVREVGDPDTLPPETPVVQGPPPAPGRAVEPDAFVAGEAVTLLSVLHEFEEQGFHGQLSEQDGEIRCLTCGTVSAPDAFTVHEVRRLEGASDPADMLAVVAAECPRCGTRGALTLNFGPSATLGADAVLAALELPG